MAMLNTQRVILISKYVPHHSQQHWRSRTTSPAGSAKGQGSTKEVTVLTRQSQAMQGLRQAKKPGATVLMHGKEGQ